MHHESDGRLTARDSAYPPSVGAMGPELSSKCADIPRMTVAPSATESAVSKKAPERTPGVAPVRRWNTLEFRCYYVAFVIVFSYMVYVPVHLSSERGNVHFAQYAHLLDSGWIPGRAVDTSDAQYRTVRSSLPLIFVLMGVYAVLSHLTAWLARRGGPHAQHTARVAFLALISTVFVSALHGVNAIKILMLSLGNYALVVSGSARLPSWSVVPLVFFYNSAALFAVFYLHGFPFAQFFPPLAWLVSETRVL